jgi:hypothetical protein
MGLLLKRSAVVVLALAVVAGEGYVVGQSPVDVSKLWEEPGDLAQRDLYHGPGGEALAPHKQPHFEFVKTDKGGYSPGYDVRDPQGMMWSVKLGPESQTEVVSSRILWAMGFHQVPTYFVADWTMKGGPGGVPGPGRFRPELPSHKVVGEWSWYENEFVDTQPYRGLVVANVLLNNWDWKTSNNKIYEVTHEQGTRRIHVVRDLGASLGKTAYPKFMSWLPMRGFGQGSRNDVADFEEQGFIKRVEGDRVEFFYRGIHQPVLSIVTKRDVVWATQLLSRVSDEQWNDAFRAAGFTPDVSDRYITKIKAKIAEGLKLADS